LVRIRDSKADIIWIGLGTPKQDLIAEKLNGLMPATYICVGAAFDFSAGNLRHAPAWMQEAGLEWLFRFVQEPRRLWRRYVFGNVRFILTVIAQLRSSRGLVGDKGRA
jgi:N-acetylglucosaminyldiphosphoundecaprenol N-acetyl-beta-D-mannosaminyltransferase